MTVIKSLRGFQLIGEMKVSKFDENTIKEYVETLLLLNIILQNKSRDFSDYIRKNGASLQRLWVENRPGKRNTTDIIRYQDWKPQNRELCYSIQSFTHENNGLGKRYVEIDSIIINYIM